MPERRICSFSHEEIEPGTGIMYVKKDGSVLWFKDSKARKNMLKLGRNPRRMKWTRRYVKGGINQSFPIDFMEKEENNTGSGNFREIIALLKKALTIYVHEGQERILEEEEYRLYREQYPFDEYYHFKEEFKCEWE